MLLILGKEQTVENTFFQKTRLKSLSVKDNESEVFSFEWPEYSYMRLLESRVSWRLNKEWPEYYQI